ncbi:MAG: efflux RND transporter permease subunit [Deltaproteobacteria bacterium]|nr:efflux RND transporter permease subunit [Deltaproteobacteria bacterium]
MNLPDLSIRRPVTSTMMILIIMVLGFVALSRIGIDFFPDLQFPEVSILTTYPGAASHEMETIVTRPLEEAVSAVEGVKKLKSRSQEGISIIQVEFMWGTDLAAAAQDIRNMMEQPFDMMPDEVDRPLVLKSDMDLMPILYYGLYSATDRDQRNLRKLIKDTVEKRLENLPGVASVTVSGGLEREIQVNVDRSRLKAYNLTIDDLIQTIREQNRDIPGGHLIKGTEEFIVRTTGKYQNVQQIADTIVKMEDGVPVYVKDLATVEDSHEEVRYYAKTNMRDSVVMWVTKESGANTVEVATAVIKEMEKLKNILPSDIRFLNVWDTSKLIGDSVNRLRETALWGGAIAFLVLLLFLWNLRTTLTLAISIPFAIITTFIAIYFAGYTLNIITLSGLALSIGMILDNSIVVLENIFRHLQEGKERKEAARIGSTEVSMAITASTLTSVIVFLPMVFATGITGQFAKPLGVTVTLALFASLLIALTMVPMIASRFLKVTGGNREGRFLTWIKSNYKIILEKSLHHRWLTVSAGVLLFIMSLFIFSLFIGGEVLPKLDEIYTSGVVKLAPGLSLDETYNFVSKVEKAIMDEPEFRSIISLTGLSQTSKYDAAQGAGATGVNESMIFYEIAPKGERKRTAVEFMDTIRSKVPPLAKGTLYFMQTNDYFTRGGGRPIEIKLFGRDLLVLKKISDQVAEGLKKEEGIVDVDISLKMGKPEMQISVDRDKASSMGITVAHVANTVDAAFLGKEATKYRDQGDEYDVRVRFSKRDRESSRNLNDVLISSPRGFMVNLTDIAEIEEGRGPVKIERENQERAVIISADTTSSDLRAIERKVKKILDTIPIPEGYYFGYGGSLEDMQELMITMLFTIGLISLLVYMVMAAQFESLTQPLSIMFAVPMSIVGVAIALFVTGTTLSVMSFIGIMILIGVVVNNGIVLIDYVNHLRAQGLEKSEAIIQGGITRLRPILMTTLTTILALLPMALNRGEGAELFSPISITIFGGLLVSTLLTLLIVPSIYSLIDGASVWTRKKLHR